MLDQHANAKLRVFAVWEPILPTDWAAPSTSALGRLSDPRVRQFWDKDHALAKIMAASHDGQTKPKCCNRHGILWDLVAIYPPKALWTDHLPTAVVFNGPIVQMMPSKLPAF
jgi:hypothetical protein